MCSASAISALSGCPLQVPTRLRRSLRTANVRTSIGGRCWLFLCTRTRQGASGTCSMLARIASLGMLSNRACRAWDELRVFGSECFARGRARVPRAFCVNDSWHARKGPLAQRGKSSLLHRTRCKCKRPGPRAKHSDPKTRPNGDRLPHTELDRPEAP